MKSAQNQNFYGHFLIFHSKLSYAHYRIIPRTRKTRSPRYF